MSKAKKKRGQAPGSIVFTGSRKVEHAQIHHLTYDEKEKQDITCHNKSQLTFAPLNSEKVEWFDVRGMHDTDLIELLGKQFDIHNLILEDVADIQQRPKFEEYKNGVFIIVKALMFDKEKLKIETEQVALFFRDGLVVTFQERETDLFESVRKRIDIGKGRIRQSGADYLSYALVDTLVDEYYLVLEDIEEVVEAFEEKLLLNPENHSKKNIHRLKRELLVLRKSIAPLREAISRFSKTDSPYVDEKTTVYIRDLYDHTIQIMDAVESYRDMLNGLQDLYLSEVSFKMNQVMQMLTVISAIFIPLTFLAGLYGMNFDYIPELHIKNGYFYLLGIMAVMFFTLLYLFKRKKWF